MGREDITEKPIRITSSYADNRLWKNVSAPELGASAVYKDGPQLDEVVTN
jgi:hypothetical protein